MWHCIDDRLPPNPGMYSVKLFTDLEREAYWTGKVWRDAKKSKKKNTVLKLRTEFRLLRYWKEKV